MGAYLVAVFAILLSAGSALTLFYTVGHFDLSDAKSSKVDRHVGV